MGTSIIDAAGICLIPKSGIKTIGRSVHFRIQHLLRGSIFNDVRRESVTRDGNLSPGEKKRIGDGFTSCVDFFDIFYFCD